MLKNIESNLNQDSITHDFELAAFTAINNAFLNIWILLSLMPKLSIEIGWTAFNY